MKKLYIIIILALIVINGKGQTVINGDYLDLNNVKALINADGINFIPSTANPIAFEVPKGSGKETVFSNCLWIGGYDAGHQLHVAAGTYRQSGRDFYQGPIDTTGTYGTTYDNTWNRVWKVKQCDIDAYYHFISTGQTGANPLDSIAMEAITHWPAFNMYGQPLAPFYDYNGDGLYDPTVGDVPLIRGDEAIFFVFNDARNSHTVSGGLPLGIEVHGLAYEYSCTSDSALFNTLFISYKITNKSSLRYDSTFIGNWSDIDLGYAFDDYTGCDVSRGAYYIYNGNSIDGTGQPSAYGANPPSQGVVFLAGAYADANGIDDAASSFPPSYLNYGDGLIDNERIGMSGFMYFNNDFTNTGNPQATDDYYQYISGYWKNGQHWTYGSNGETGGTVNCNYIYPDNSDPTGFGTNSIPQPSWNEVTSANAPGDRRGLGATGSFTFQPYQSQYLDFAYVFGRATSGGNLASVTVMQNRIDSVRQKYNYAIIGRNWNPINPPFVCGCSVSTGINELVIDNNILVYPNPSEGMFQIKSVNFKIQTLKVMNIIGEEILESKINNKQAIIDLSGVAKGIYFLQITTSAGSENETIVNKKIVVQ